MTIANFYWVPTLSHCILYSIHLNSSTFENNPMKETSFSPSLYRLGNSRPHAITNYMLHCLSLEENLRKTLLTCRPNTHSLNNTDNCFPVWVCFFFFFPLYTGRPLNSLMQHLTLQRKCSFVYLVELSWSLSIVPSPLNNNKVRLASM